MPKDPNDYWFWDGGEARRASPAVPEPAAAAGPLAPNQRWTVTRKREVALRLLRGEPFDALARELGVEIYRLEEWKNKALAGIDASLPGARWRPVGERTAVCRGKIGQLMMDNELLREKVAEARPFGRRGD